MTAISRTNRRPAFTLIELLVVIAIIAILVALTAAGVAQIIMAQKKSTTTTLIQKTDGAVEQQWRAEVDDAKDQAGNISANILAMAGNDPERAKVIWTKLRLKRRFPMSYREAVFPWLPADPTLVGAPLVASDMPPKAPYVMAVGGRTGNPTNPSPAEMSACLLLALSQTTRGMTFSGPDALGRTAIRDTDGDGLEEIVDVYGQPVGFYRWGTANADLINTNLPSPSRINTRFRDPLDPLGKLLDAKWNNAASYQAHAGVYWFEQYFHPVHVMNGSTWQPIAYYTVPTIVSAGRNERLGLSWPLMGPISPDADDNIYSFAVR